MNAFVEIPDIIRVVIPGPPGPPGPPGGIEIPHIVRTAVDGQTSLSAAQTALITLTLNASTQLAVSNRPSDTAIMLYLRLVQDAVGGRIVSVPKGWYAANGAQPLTATGPGDVSFATLSIPPAPATPIIFSLLEYRLAAIP
jgi:hypothetical protein